MKDEKLRCDCGKWVAVKRGDKVYVWCKHCKKEVELPVIVVSEPSTN